MSCVAIKHIMLFVVILSAIMLSDIMRHFSVFCNAVGRCAKCQQYAVCPAAECHYAKCRYAEGRCPQTIIRPGTSY